MSATIYTSANLGASGLTGTAGFAVYPAGSSTPFAARTTAGVVEVPAGSGIYSSSFQGDGSADYLVIWDDGGSPPAHAGDSIGPAPTADQVADAVLLRDWTAIVGTVPARCLLQAARWLRNAWTATGTTLTVKAEDDATTAWSKPITTDAEALPVTGTGNG